MKKYVFALLAAFALSFTACADPGQRQADDVADSQAAVVTDHIGIALTGQSNCVGGAKLVDITDPVVEADLGTPYTAVTLTSKLGANKNDPITWEEYETDSLAPRPDFHHHFGVELTLGRGLDAEFEEPVDLIKFAGNGMGMIAHRGPNANYPTLPTGTDTFNDQMLEWTSDTSLDLEADIKVLVEIGGEYDAKDLHHAKAYDDEAAVQREEFEAVVGHPVAHVVLLLNDDQGGEFNDNVRTSQIYYEEWGTCVGLVYADDLELRDSDHYTADAYVELGYRISDKIADLRDADCLN
jgi:hypothetical protein